MSHNHEEAFIKDELRQKRLEHLGVIFLRFAEAEVKYDIINVIRCIEAKVIEIVKQAGDIKLPKGFDLGVLDR